MITIWKTAREVTEGVAGLRAAGRTIGFVPTMGALHQGHLSLIEQALIHCNEVIVSIFVNPTQFNDKSDLKNYPRMPESDIAMLEHAGAGFVFIPSEQEIYPEPDNRVFDFGHLDKVMEGAHRPGHFNGVAQVVSRLFELVSPHKAFFGQKDFQQLAIIKQLVRMLNLNVEIIGCPIVREKDGLAMSSRNLLLDPDRRKAAPRIYATLCEARNKMDSTSVKELIGWVEMEINRDPLLKVEYFEIVDAETLLPVTDWDSVGSIVGCIAVWAGKIRLIDNITFK